MAANFQALASRQGRAFHNQALESLEFNGFEIQKEQVPFDDVGIRIDAVAMNRHGISIPFEFKGSYRGDRPGLIRTDSVLKAIAEAYLLRQSEEGSSLPPMVVLTSHLPDSGGALSMINACQRNVVLGFWEDRNTVALRWLFNADEDEIIRLIELGEPNF